MTAIAQSQTVQSAAAVPDVSPDEAHGLLRTEYERFLELVESLSPSDWGKPTACTAWTVRDVLAHQAGGYASGSGYRAMIRQYSAMPKKGQLPEDAVNERQLRERAGRSPADLIAELRQVGPVAVQKWAYRFRAIKPLSVPHPVGGTLSIRHLMWVIHSRDTWMHRLDISRATGREFQQSRKHDGRIVALVIRDADRLLRGKLGGHAVRLDLSGIAGGIWQVGPGEPIADIQMDALDFCVFSSGRSSLDEARAKATLSGDVPLAELALRSTLLLY